MTQGNDTVDAQLERARDTAVRLEGEVAKERGKVERLGQDVVKIVRGEMAALRTRVRAELDGLTREIDSAWGSDKVELARLRGQVAVKDAALRTAKRHVDETVRDYEMAGAYRGLLPTWKRVQSQIDAALSTTGAASGRVPEALQKETTRASNPAT